MKEVLVLLVTAALASSQLTSRNDPAWLTFKNKFQYSSPHEESRRYQIFRSNVDDINRVNSRNLTYRVGINEFANLTFQEFAALYLMSPSESPRLRASSHTHPYTASALGDGNFPAEFDWRTRNIVTPVKDQRWQGRPCKTCSAFSAVGALESALAKKTGVLVSLSEQNIIDCTLSASGCYGGQAPDAFVHVMSAGIQTMESYPYTAGKGRCKFNPRKAAAYMKYYAQVPKNEKALLGVLVNVGPISVSMSFTQSIERYRGGVWADDRCGKSKGQLRHAMLLVGYGTEGGQDYWLLKNSWGENWGEGGYLKMARNRNNMCGIASEAYVPKEVSSRPLRLKERLASPADGKQPGIRSPAGVSPCSSSATVTINTSLLLLLFAAIRSV